MALVLMIKYEESFVVGDVTITIARAVHKGRTLGQRVKVVCDGPRSTPIYRLNNDDDGADYDADNEGNQR